MRIVFTIAAAMYAGGAIYNLFMLPRPITDRPAVEACFGAQSVPEMQ